MAVEPEIETPLAAGTDVEAGVSAAAQREYDGFGPWILEVKTPGDMPPRFRERYAEHAGAKFLLKLPRPEERRNLRPGMDLYPVVLAVHEDRVCLMACADGTIVTRGAACGDVQAIRVHQHLLKGLVELLLADGSSFEFGYNASSQGMVDKVVGFLRQRLPAPASSWLPGGPVPVEDYSFQGMLGDQLRLGPELRAVHFEPPGRACRDLEGRRRLSLGLLILASPRELVAVTQGRTARRRKEAALATEALYLPWAALAGWRRVADPDRRCSWHSLRLQVRGHARDLDLFEPGALEAILAAAAPPAP